ncbi:VWA domain-containing protein [Roseibium polysiphoniae]|uniref:VWA domain-containing protein n=1 Tax=Roseibium polysiphoniae TaxID=2571221 RepID=A0A944GUK6_9HYPH|nr:VWA domain-containing protein [Roseibium polysiphoniae]MBS8262554.1 VWA domain-containing protein [Roseibium polysiphoniae]
MIGNHIPRAILISSASILTLAFVAIAVQSINWPIKEENPPQQPVAGQLAQDEHTTARDAQTAPSHMANFAKALRAPTPETSTPSASGGGFLGLSSTQGRGTALKGPGQGGTTRRADVPPPQFLSPEGDQFASVDANPLKNVSDDPVSTFSIDVDTASYSYVRRSLTNARLPKSDAVRVEEMLNYFDYDYQVPETGGAPFSTNVSVVQTPWNKHTKLMQVGIQGHKVPLAELPPQNLVFLIDTSGSMKHETKLPLLQQSFRLLLTSLRDEDEVAIVTYAGKAGVLLEPTRVTDRDKILDKINALTSGGSTAGHDGLKGAYALAEKMTGEGEQTRVILATDGDFNVGISDPDSLKRFVSDKREQGTGLSVLGFGHGNYNDELMQALAQNGQGVAAYIDTVSEARKVLVDQVVSSISMIAKDVKIQVEFNPQTVAEYRLIGYETRALKTEDFKNDKVDAGDIGAGHNVTALYEITPVGSPAIKFPDGRYSPAEETPTSVDDAYSGELAFVKLRYKAPGEDESKLIETPVRETDQNIPVSETLFAASVASFGQLLKGTDYLGNWSYEDSEKLARENRGADRFGYRSEFLTILRLAQTAKQ